MVLNFEYIANILSNPGRIIGCTNKPYSTASIIQEICESSEKELNFDWIVDIFHLLSKNILDATHN